MQLKKRMVCLNKNVMIMTIRIREMIGKCKIWDPLRNFREIDKFAIFLKGIANFAIFP